MSLTVHEQTFISHVLENGDDDELAILDENLRNESIFFDVASAAAGPTTMVAGGGGANDQPPPTSSRCLPPDSTARRLSVLEARKNCKKSIQLWKDAALKVVVPPRNSRSSINNAAVPFTTRAMSMMSVLSHDGTLRSVDEKKESAGEEEFGKDSATWDLNELDAFDRLALEDAIKAAEDEDDDQDEEDDVDDDGSDESNTLQIRLRQSSASTSKDAPSTGQQIRKASIFLYNGQGFEVDDEQIFSKYSDLEEHYDPWISTETDEEGHKFDFHILGTSHDDDAAQPHVLTPILMHSLQPHLPGSKRGESFWLKYSLVRDGASTATFLQHLRGCTYTLLAMETVDGEVFGAFVGHPWTIQPSYFGSPESFVWRMKHARTAGDHDHHHTPGDSLREQAQKEADIEVFSPQHSLGGNDFYQLCRNDRIAVGGGAGTTAQNFGDDIGTFTPKEMGFALTLGEDGHLMHGSSSPCLTFFSPSLSKVHADGSIFELVNLEAWGLTPCITEHEARMMEFQRLFLKRNTTVSRR